MARELQALLESVAYEPLAVPETLEPLVLLMAGHSAALGFPSPAEDFNCEPVDVIKKLMPYPQSMFLMRVKGPSMREDGIFDDDILVVSRAIKPLMSGTIESAIRQFSLQNGSLWINDLRARRP